MNRIGGKIVRGAERHTRDQTRNKFRPQSSARALSVYDGRSCLGSIIINEAGEAYAFDPNGALLGFFPNLKNALATFSTNKAGAGGMTQPVASGLSPAEMEARIAALEMQLASLEICPTCGGLPCVNPNFCEACGRADRKGAVRHHLERLRRLLADDVSLERAWHELQEAFADNPDLRQVVNSGWTRGQGVVRCDADTNEPTKFSTFCPKAIALKGKEAPDTILSRAIFITLRRRIKSEAVAHFDHIDDVGFRRLRSQLARWAADNGEALGMVRPGMPDGFLNRTASNWQHMFAIADSLSEEAGARAREAAQNIVGIADLTSAGVALLRDIKKMFDRSTLDYLTSKAIIDDLAPDLEKRWAEWSCGKPITEKGVAELLREYLISSKTVGLKGARAKGYRKADFEDAWRRYLASPNEAHPLTSDNLPFTRSPLCNDYAFAEKTAVHQDGGERQKSPYLSNDTNAVNGRTGEYPETAPRPNSTTIPSSPTASGAFLFAKSNPRSGRSATT